MGLESPRGSGCCGGNGSQSLPLRRQEQLRPNKGRLGHPGGSGLRRAPPAPPTRVAARSWSELPGSTAAKVPASTRVGDRDSLHLAFALREFRGDRRGGKPLRKHGLWRHLPRKPRRKCGSRVARAARLLRVALGPQRALFPQVTPRNTCGNSYYAFGRCPPQVTKGRS